MRHGSLFSGIGGFDLAAEWMGWDNIFHCEWMPFPRQVLKYHFPKSLSYEDITKTDFTIHRGSIDILTGGFPCQPYSSAGKRLGKEDERHLWPHMLRAIQEIEPTYVVGENVRGLTNWNGGVVFEEVCADLEACGYEVQPILLPACAVGAPHRRDRVWFIAYSNRFSHRRTTEFTSITHKQRWSSQTNTRKWNERQQQSLCDITSTGTATNSDNFRQHECECNNEEFTSERGKYAFNDFDENDGQGTATNSNGEGRRELRYKSEENGTQYCNELSTSKYSISNNECDATNTKCERLYGLYKTRNENNINRKNTKIWRGSARYNEENNWHKFPTQPPICGGDDGLPTELDGITFSKWRQESIKGYGNAIVPQVAYEIFKVINQMHYDTISR
jgi:DNA (cytosine-5)-methyltransferase 1